MAGLVPAIYVFACRYLCKPGHDEQARISRCFPNFSSVLALGLRLGRINRNAKIPNPD